MKGRQIGEDQILEPGTAKANHPPKRPWKPGVHEEYSCFRLRVYVTESKGDVWSDHEPEALEDEEVFPTLQSGGLRQAAYALFTEALRKESLYTALLKISNDQDFANRVISAHSIKEIEKIEKEIAIVVFQTFQGEMEKNAHAVARETIDYIRKVNSAKPK